MSDKDTRNSVLDRLLGRRGAAEEARDKVNDLDAALQNEGLEHKARDVNTLTRKDLLDLLGAFWAAGSDVEVQRVSKQAMMTAEDLADLIVAGAEMLADVPPEEQRDAALAMVRDLLQEETDVQVEGLMDGEETPPPTEEDRAERARRLDMIETVMDDQAAILTGLTEVKALAKNLADLNLKGVLDGLKAEIEAIKRQLRLRPRGSQRASEAESTQAGDVLDAEELKELKDGAKKVTTLPGTSIRVLEKE